MQNPHVSWFFSLELNSIGQFFLCQATFRNSILNAKTIEDQYVNSRHKRRAPQIPQNLTLAPIMKKKARQGQPEDIVNFWGQNSWH